VDRIKKGIRSSLTVAFIWCGIVISSGIELLTKFVSAILLAPELEYWAIILAEPISWVLMVIPLIIQIRTNSLLKEAK